MADPNHDRFAQAALTRAQKNQVITSAAVTAVKVPTLGIVGSLDGYLADFQELKKLRPEIQMVVIDNATHGTAPRQPEFIATVRRFLARYPASR